MLPPSACDLGTDNCHMQCINQYPDFSFMGGAPSSETAADETAGAGLTHVSEDECWCVVDCVGDGSNKKFHGQNFLLWMEPSRVLARRTQPILDQVCHGVYATTHAVFRFPGI